MLLTHLDLLLWAAGFVGHLAILMVLLIRRRARKFPAFTSLIVLNVLRTVALFFISREATRAVYFYVFWSLALADVALQFLVVYELASQIFRPLGHWASDVRGRLGLWFAGSLGFALLLTWIPAPASSFWMQVIFLKGSFFSAALMSELFVGMIALSSVSGLNWSSHVAKIAQGFAVYSVATLIFETANTSLGLRGDGRVYNALSLIRMILYLGCLAYWIASLCQDAPSGQNMPPLISRQVSAISRAVEYRLNTLRSEGDS